MSPPRRRSPALAPARRRFAPAGRLVVERELLRRRPAARSSLAGGLVYMFQIAGGAVGLGVSTAIFTSSSESQLGDLVSDETGFALTGHEQAVLHGTLAGTDAAADALAELPARVAAEINRLVADSFAHGVQTTFRVIAVVAIVGFLVAILDLARTPDPEDPPG